MSDRLAQRYERLLEAYPEGYRDERGAEILSTLLDGAKPGQRWPSVRESGALLAGALQTRLAQASPSFRAWWYGAGHLVVMLLLIPKVYDLVMSAFGNYYSYTYEYGVATGSSVAVAVWAVVGVVALGAVLARWYRTALAAVAALAVLELALLGRVATAAEVRDPVVVNLAVYAALLALLVAFAVRPPVRTLRPPRTWIAVVLTIALMVPPYVSIVPSVLAEWDILFGLGILASLLLGLFDLRVPAAAALYLLGAGAFTLAVNGSANGAVTNLVATLVSATLLAGASVVAQRMVVRL